MFQEAFTKLKILQFNFFHLHISPCAPSLRPIMTNKQLCKSAPSVISCYHSYVSIKEQIQALCNELNGKLCAVEFAQTHLLQLRLQLTTLLFFLLDGDLQRFELGIPLQAGRRQRGRVLLQVDEAGLRTDAQHRRLAQWLCGARTHTAQLARGTHSTCSNVKSRAAL